MTCRLYGKGHCQWCRTHPEWRAEVRMPDVCPDGVTADNLPPPLAAGPGTELKRILASSGINPGNCACLSMARKMDAWGPDGCEAHMAEIVATMTETANRRGWWKLVPFKAIGARGLVMLAIERARAGTAA